MARNRKAEYYVPGQVELRKQLEAEMSIQGGYFPGKRALEIFTQTTGIKFPEQEDVDVLNKIMFFLGYDAWESGYRHRDAKGGRIDSRLRLRNFTLQRIPGLHVA